MIEHTIGMIATRNATCTTTYSAGYALLPTQEQLPLYELDPMFNDPAVRKRIGEVIAKAMEHRFSKR